MLYAKRASYTLCCKKMKEFIKYSKKTKAPINRMSKDILIGRLKQSQIGNVRRDKEDEGEDKEIKVLFEGDE